MPSAILAVYARESNARAAAVSVLLTEKRTGAALSRCRAAFIASFASSRFSSCFRGCLAAVRTFSSDYPIDLPFVFSRIFRVMEVAVNEVLEYLVTHGLRVRHRVDRAAKGTRVGPTKLTARSKQTITGREIGHRDR